ASVDNLLFLASSADGVAVISIADPLKPSVIRMLRDGLADGLSLKLNPTALQIAAGRLHVIGDKGRYIFDLTKPAMPQTAFSKLQAPSSVLPDQSSLAAADGSSDAILYDLTRINHIRELGRYDSHGFDIPGTTTQVLAQTSISGSVCVEQCEKNSRQHSLALFDMSRAEQITLLDALNIGQCGTALLKQSILTDDGVWVGAMTDELILLDTLVLDLLESEPLNGATGTPTDQVIELRFNRDITIPLGETEAAYLSRYLALLLDDGTQAGQNTLFTAALAAGDASRILITPDAPLQPNSTYHLDLSGELGSRRTQGLFDHRITFTTATGANPLPVITDIQPTILSTKGGEITVTLRHGDNPLFLLSGENAPVLSATSVDDEHTAYTILAPANLAGPAKLNVSNSSGGQTSLLGAVQYIEPLVLQSASPAQGSVNGGTTVILKGAGFRPGLSRVSVFFDEIAADPAKIKVLDVETISVETPAGRIGPADITVKLDTGQQAVLENAFDYQQPIQTNIQGKGRIYDVALDPTGTYLVAAAGAAGITIYNINASSFTANAEIPLNLDDLRRTIDLDENDLDDRIAVSVPLPEGYLALGVDTFFERATDRVFVTATKLDANGQPQPESARLFIIGFDASDPSQTTVIGDLPLPASFARGIEVENGKAVVAMADGGIGLFDSFLQTKVYLGSQLLLPNGHSALDVTRIPTLATAPSRYAAVAGDYDIKNNRLLQAMETESGGFYLLELSAAEGFRVLGMVPVPASRVVVVGDHAYLAAGEAGMVVVDISDPENPFIVSRVNGIGHIYDVSVSGTTAYLARGEAGVLTVDVTNPSQPVTSAGMEAFPGNTVEVILAGNYAAYSAGISGVGASVVQVTNDVILKIHRVDPQSRILDRDSAGELTVIVRFNKDIDLWDDNLQRFKLLGPDGSPLLIDVDIVSNDAILTPRDVSGLQAGDTLTVVAHAGIRSVKPLPDNRFITLYELAQDQRVSLTYRDAQPNTFRVEAVVPRHIQQGRAQQITVSGLGIPTDVNRVKLFAGGIEASVTQVASSDEVERVAIITATLPAFVHAGLFDVTVQIERDGVWESATLHGGLMVDDPIHFESLTPSWGAVTGGTTITITGSGFEPGNTVTDGLKVRIGSVPAASIRVLSSNKIEVVSRGGPVGRNDLHGEDRYGNVTSLTGDQGFGYGLKRLARQAASNIFPSDIVVDQETGVAMSNGGFLYESDLEKLPFRTVQDIPFPDSTLAATFDIQRPDQPLLVGGVSSLPDGSEGREALERHVQLGILMGRELMYETVDNAPPLSDEERSLMEQLQGSLIDTSIDSIRIHPTQELEEGVMRKRLYVAAGIGGVIRLNLDDQNGLQVLSRIAGGSTESHVTDVLKWG
ncbi:MAG: IPT/TIG domain-containing protein, partial [Chromatiales bacterium]